VNIQLDKYVDIVLLAESHPTLEELKGAFPDSTIQGYKNCDVWLKYVIFA